MIQKSNILCFACRWGEWCGEVDLLVPAGGGSGRQELWAECSPTGPDTRCHPGHGGNEVQGTWKHYHDKKVGGTKLLTRFQGPLDCEMHFLYGYHILSMVKRTCFGCMMEVLWYIGMNARYSPLLSYRGLIPTIAPYFCPSARHFVHIAALYPGV